MEARRALAVLGVGVAGSQAGHLLAYQLRFGDAAQQLQAAGAHAYFPAVAKTAAGLVSLALLAAMLIVGAARVAGGRRIEPGSSPSFVRLLAVLFTLQLGCFAVQETAEALVGGGRVGSAPLLLLWGTAGQLPVALAATLALRWLGARVRPALAALRVRLTLSVRLVPTTTPWGAWPLATDLALSDGTFEHSHVRGPPSF